MLTGGQCLRAGIEPVCCLLWSLINDCPSRSRQWCARRNGIPKINPAEIDPSRSGVLTDICTEQGLGPAGIAQYALAGGGVRTAAIGDHAVPTGFGKVGDVVGSGEQVVPEVTGIDGAGQPELVEVADILNAPGLLLGSGKGWQHHRCQDGDDGDDHQQFNEGEGRPGVSSPSRDIPERE